MCAANGKISTRFYELSSMVDRTGWGHAAAIMQDLNVTPTDVNMDDPSQPPPPTSTDADEKARVATEELLSRFVGLALDGTASMSSDSLGAQAALRTHMNAGAVFAWCAAHLLSLASVGAVEGAGVHAVFPRVFSLLRSLWVYFRGSSSRLVEISRSFEEIVDLCEGPLKNINEPAKTRWLSHGYCASVICGMWPALAAALRELGKTDVEALCLLSQLEDLTTCAAMHLVAEVLETVDILSKSLQDRELTVLDMVDAVDGTIATLEALNATPLRGLTYPTFVKAHEAATNSHGLHPTRTVEDFHQHYGHAFVKAIRDGIVSRFADREHLSLFGVFDIRCHPDANTPYGDFGEAELQLLLAYYCTEKTASCARREVTSVKPMPEALVKKGVWPARPTISYGTATTSTTKTHPPLLPPPTGVPLPTHVLNVTRQWQQFLFVVDSKRLRNLETKTSQTLYELICRPQMRHRFPDVFALMQLCMTLPVSSAEAERMFSLPKLIKTSLRNRLHDTTLSCIMRIASHPVEHLSPHQMKKVLDEFFSRKHRRIEAVSQAEWDAYVDLA